MSSHKQRNEWMNDVERRQRNIVFPDTVANEARFWRNAVEGRLTTLQKIGLTAVTCTMASVLIVWSFELFPGTDYSTGERILNAIVAWGIAALVVGSVLLFVRWRIKNANSKLR